jgi:hypothetical protein
MTRTEVYKLIDGERNYQDALGKDRKSGVQHTPGDYATMLARYMMHATIAWADNSGATQEGKDAFLAVIRKIAGISVHCMEDHGAPPR